MNGADVVQVPLSYRAANMLFPNKGDLDKASMEKLMGASIHRLLIIKSREGSISVKVSTIIPDYNYALNHGFDISDFDIRSIPKDFSGFIFSRNWSESVVSLYRVNKNGQLKSCRLRLANEAPVISKSSSGSVTNSTGTCWYCGFNGAIGASGMFECTSYFPAGDAPGGNNGIESQCQHWESNSGDGNGFDWNDYPDDPEDPDFPDLCALYGIGCDNGGGGGGGAYEENINWFNASPDYTINTNSDDLGTCGGDIVNTILNQANSTIKAIKDLFSESTKFNLIFKLDNTLPSNVGGRTKQTPFYEMRDDVYYGILTKLDVTININPRILSGNDRATKMSIAATVMHEMIHAYFLYRQADALNNPIKESKLAEDLGFLKVYDPNAAASTYGSYSHHEQMATSYIDKLAAALKEFSLISDANLNSLRNSSYPTLTLDEYYRAMAWSGLTEPQNYTGAVTKAWQTFQDNNTAERTAMYKFIISAEENGTSDAPSQTKCP